MLGGPPAKLFDAAHRRGRRRRLVVLASAAALLLAGCMVYTVWSLAAHRAAAEPPREVTLVIDVSGSMQASDVRPTRLAAAVAAATGFVDQLPKSVEVGVVAFSDAANVVQLPTRNRRRVLGALQTLRPISGTALGTGLETGVQLTERDRGGDVVLISDGSQNRGLTTPLQAADLARLAGIHVYAVALGTPGGTVSFGGGQYMAHIPVPPDPAVTTQIAGVTGGEAFVARDSTELGDAFDSVQRKLG